MNINQIGPIAGISDNTSNPTQTVSEAPGFGTIMNAAIRLFEETSLVENELSQYQTDFAAGRTDDMLAVMLAEQRAQTAVTFTAQLTSRVMDAYRQIMNLQI